MTMSDPLADMFTRIRNSTTARHEWVRVPTSNVKRAVAGVLRAEGFIAAIEEEEEGPLRYLRLRITYGEDRKAVLGGIRRVSKPGLRVYVNRREVPRVLGGLGIAILSTSQGVMSDREAWRRRIGGEVLCYVW
jgi:small subunit ribosomal protein S8